MEIILYTPSKKSLEFNPELANATPADASCPLALPAEEQAETESQGAELLHLVNTSGSQIWMTNQELHKYGHHPGHVLVSTAVNTSMAKITALENKLGSSSGPATMSAAVQAALQRAHGLDNAIATVKIVRLQEVLGVKEIPGSSPDEEYDLSSTSVKPGPRGSDELTV